MKQVLSCLDSNIIKESMHVLSLFSSVATRNGIIFGTLLPAASSWSHILTYHINRFSSTNMHWNYDKNALNTKNSMNTAYYMNQMGDRVGQDRVEFGRTKIITFF